MDELARQLSSLRDELSPQWDDTRSERLYAGVGALGRRRQRQRIGLVAASIVGAGALFLMSSPSSVTDGGTLVASVSDKGTIAASRSAEVRTLVSSGQELRLSEGSVAQLVSASGQLEVLRDEKKHVDLRLLSGTAHFDVAHEVQRKFVIDAGMVKVAVIGTVFDVERARGRVRVSVSEGKVRVQSARGESFVSAGEASWFDANGVQSAVPAAAPSPAPEAETAELGSAAEDEQRAELHAEHVRRAPRRDAAAKASWRSLTQAGDYDAAYRALAQGTTVEDDALALMDAADAARLSGHPGASVAYLRRVTRDHRGSPVAPLAAFTLARVLLERLGEPSEAAEAFALARSLAPFGSLAQDALAREVEALSKAGNAHEAFLRAQQYVKAYPQGRRLHAVKLYGGIE